MRLLTLVLGAQLSFGLKVAEVGTRLAGAGVVVPATVGEGVPVLRADFTKPMSIPEEGMEAAMEVMRSGRLFRYTQPAETSQVSQAEAEFAEMVGQKYALGVNSCSSAIMIAMIVCGVESGDEVITNGLTFTALPSTIMRLGATPVLVEATPNWTMDLDDLEKKAAAHPKAKVLVLSHMRGKIAHMERVVEICEKHGLTLVEDCAHSCGVKWKGRQIGYHAAVSAYSTQSDKVINSGEGGFITSDDPEMMAKAIYLSGAYEARYKHHIAAPDAALCEDAMMKMPNLSSRMSELTAAVLRPLIKNLPERVVKYNERYDKVVAKLRAGAAEHLVVPEQLAEVEGVGDHLNFYLTGVTKEQNAVFIDTAKALGVPLGWFASKINARNHVNWRKFGSPTYDLPNTDALLATAYDLKMPPHFTDADIETLADVLVYAVNAATAPPCEPEDDTCVDA